MAAKKVFVTFDYDNHRYYKNLLVSLNKDHELELEFYDASLRESIDSANGDHIKLQIKPMIERASHVLCIIGKNCARSKWFNWEIQTAAALGKNVAAVKVQDTCPTPSALLSGVVWAPEFAFEAIKAAIEASAPLPALPATHKQAAPTQAAAPTQQATANAQAHR